MAIFIIMIKMKEIYRWLSPKYQNLYLDYPVRFRPRYGHGKPEHPELYRIIDAGRKEYGEFLHKALRHTDRIQAIRPSVSETDSDQPVWDNGFLPGLDIFALYAMLAERKPGRYLEIGSGTSTKVAYKAKKEQSPKTEIVSVDPQPRTGIDALADRIIRQPFEDIDAGFFTALETGDILFIDNSHRILPNSDSMVFFLEVIPRLKKGVIVHLHDIYLPWDYPPEMCERYYSEQYGLAMLLMANPGRYRPILPNFFISEDPELDMILEPLWEHPNLEGAERHGGSFWLEIKE